MNKHTPTGHEVWRWPEFKALAKRLGINTELPTTRLLIDMPVDAEVTVHQTYLTKEGETDDGQS